MRWYTKSRVWTVKAAVGSPDDSWKRSSLCSFVQHSHNWLTGICVWRSSRLTSRNSVDCLCLLRRGVFWFVDGDQTKKQSSAKTKHSGPTSSHAVIHLRCSGCLSRLSPFHPNRFCDFTSLLDFEVKVNETCKARGDSARSTSDSHAQNQKLMFSVFSNWNHNLTQRCSRRPALKEQSVR